MGELVPGDFSLDDGSPTVALAARNSKNRKAELQPLPVETAAQLKAYLAGKAADRRVWEGTWAQDRRGAEMLRGDLEAAGIPYAVPSGDGPLDADFHSLRHSHPTVLGRRGVDLRTAQELAGHSTPTLTARYTHTNQSDLAAAVGRLPIFHPTAGTGSPANLPGGVAIGPPTLAPAHAQVPRVGYRRLHLFALLVRRARKTKV